MYHHKLYLLLVILVVSCHAAFEETSRFLTDNGFGHVSQQFMEEEIKVRQIPSLPDQVLADLGVRTVGARLRLRSVASRWVPNQVISFLSLEISFVQIFFQNRLFPFPSRLVCFHVAIFFSYSMPGRITHHFSHGAYRMDRVSVKPNGRAYFSCSVKSCRAR